MSDVSDSKRHSPIGIQFHMNPLDTGHTTCRLLKASESEYLLVGDLRAVRDFRMTGTTFCIGFGIKLLISSRIKPLWELSSV